MNDTQNCDQSVTDQEDLTIEQKEEATAKLLVQLQITTEELESTLEENRSLRNSLAIRDLEKAQLEDELQELTERFNSLQAQNGNGGVSNLLRSIVSQIEINNNEHMVALFSRESNSKLDQAA